MEGYKILRVIAGEVRGRKLNTVPGMNTRPTSDKVKEGLFNILSPYLRGAKVLDLFAGTGSLSIEALSRGARLAVLVERNHAALKVIKENLETTGYTEKAVVLNMDVFNALNKLSQSDEKFDIILIDPPYATGLARKTAGEVLKSGVLGSDGVIVAEYDRYDVSENEEAGGAKEADRASYPKPYREKKYGRTVLAFYRTDAMFTGNGEGL